MRNLVLLEQIKRKVGYAAMYYLMNIIYLFTQAALLSLVTSVIQGDFKRRKRTIGKKLPKTGTKK